jgi:transcriptional regulator with XRE-family HTH domain
VSKRKSSKSRPAAPPTVSESIRSEIRSRRLTAYAAAKLAGVDASVLQRFLTGERGLSMRTLDRVCLGLGLSLQPTPTVETNPTLQPDPPRRPLPGQAELLPRDDTRKGEA